MATPKSQFSLDQYTGGVVLRLRVIEKFFPDCVAEKRTKLAVVTHDLEIVCFLMRNYLSEIWWWLQVTSSHAAKLTQRREGGVGGRAASWAAESGCS